MSYLPLQTITSWKLGMITLASPDQAMLEGTEGQEYSINAFFSLILFPLSFQKARQWTGGNRTFKLLVQTLKSNKNSELESKILPDSQKGVTTELILHSFHSHSSFRLLWVFPDQNKCIISIESGFVLFLFSGNPSLGHCKPTILIAKQQGQARYAAEQGVQGTRPSWSPPQDLHPPLESTQPHLRRATSEVVG